MNLQNHSFRKDLATKNKKEDQKATSAHLKENELVKFGEHSVYLKGVIAEPCFLDEEAIAKLSNEPNWWQTVPAAWLRDRAQANGRNEWEVNSHVYFIEDSKLIVTAAPSLRTSEYMEDGVEVCSVNWVEPVTIGKLDMDCLCDEKTGNMNSSVILQKLAGTIQQFNFDANLDILKHMESNVDTWDNTGIYAKLIHFALIRDHAETHNISLLPIECDADVNFVSAIDHLKNEKGPSPGIYLVENHDVTLDSLDLMFLLSTNSKSFVNSAEKTHDRKLLLASRFIVWDKIKVFVLTVSDWNGLKVCPTIDPQLITAARVYSFVEKLAQLRGEEDQLARGLYIAMDLCGIYYPGGAKRWLSHIFGSTNYNLPMPRDYNVFARLLQVKPLASSIASTTEWEAFKCFSSRDKIASIAIYLKLENVAATTLMASINLVGEHIQSWLRISSHPGIPTLNNLINILNLPVPNQNVPDALTDSKFRLQVKGLAGKWAGFSNIKRNYVKTYWLGKKSSITDLGMKNLFRGSNSFAPRVGSALAIIDLIDKLPYEWCLGFAGSQMDISKEISRFRIDPLDGWRATIGSRVYASDSSTPYIFHAYGWQVLNILSLLRKEKKMGNILWQFADFLHGGKKEMGPVVNESFNGAEWNCTVCCWEPNTMKSWIWEKNKVVAPALSFKDNWWEALSGKETGIYRPNHPTEFDCLMNFNCGFLKQSDVGEADGEK